MGKGSTPRPFSVDQSTFDSNWDQIFKKPKKTEGELQAEAFLRDEYYDLDDRWDHYSGLPNPKAYRKDDDANKS